MDIDQTTNLSSEQLILLQSVSSARNISGMWIDPSKNIDTLAIGCMDDRFWKIFTDLQKGNNVIALRNGGGMVSEMLGEIDLILQALPSIKHIKVYTHENCGAMDYCHKVITGKIDPSSELEKKMVSHMLRRLSTLADLDITTMTVNDIENFNRDFKKGILDVYFKGRAKVHEAELVGIDSLAKRPDWHDPNVHGDAAVIFIPPTNVYTPEQISIMGLGAEQKRAYQVKRITILNALLDFELAFQLGIKELRLVSLGDADDKRVRERITMLNNLAKHDPQREFLKEVKITPVYFDKAFANLLRSEGISITPGIRKAIHNK